MRDSSLGVLVPVALTACAFLAGCNNSTTGTPVSASVPASSDPSSATTTATPSLDLSPPTTAVPNPRVTGTVFDGCAAVTKAEEAEWGLRPDSKHDTADNGPLGAEGVRGCLWNGEKGQVRVYAFDGTVSKWSETYKAEYDRIEPTRFGTREGLVAHNAPDQIQGCVALLPSQSGIAAVMTLPSRALEKQGVDMCPWTAEIMTAIEPRIP